MLLINHRSFSNWGENFVSRKKTLFIKFVLHVCYIDVITLLINHHSFLNWVGNRAHSNFGRITTIYTILERMGRTFFSNYNQS